MILKNANDDTCLSDVLIDGWVEITQTEFEAIQAARQVVPDAKTVVRFQLEVLDVDNTLTQRNLRETILLMAEAFKQVTNGAVDLSKIPGVAKVQEVEAQAAVLRAQL